MELAITWLGISYDTLLSSLVQMVPVDMIKIRLFFNKSKRIHDVREPQISGRFFFFFYIRTAETRATNYITGNTQTEGFTCTTLSVH